MHQRKPRSIVCTTRQGVVLLFLCPFNFFANMNGYGDLSQTPRNLQRAYGIRLRRSCQRQFKKVQSALRYTTFFVVGKATTISARFEGLNEQIQPHSNHSLSCKANFMFVSISSLFFLYVVLFPLIFVNFVLFFQPEKGSVQRKTDEGKDPKRGKYKYGFISAVCGFVIAPPTRMSMAAGFQAYLLEDFFSGASFSGF